MRTLPLLTLHFEMNIMLRKYFSSVPIARVRNELVMVQKFPGSRAILIQDDSSPSSNPLSLNMLGRIGNLVDIYNKNLAVSAIFFGSSSSDVFSTDIDQSELRTHYFFLNKEVQNLITKISKCTKSTLAIYSGNFSGTTYGAFSSSQVFIPA